MQNTKTALKRKSGKSDQVQIKKDEWLLPLVPVIMFSAVTIMIVRMHIYARPMGQFFWTTETDESALTDFFSYHKMQLIVVTTCLAVIIFLFQIVSRSIEIKRSAVYIPMAIYALFVLLSYYRSAYKEFALWGYNDRFEGTVTLLCYMFMLFYTINNVDSERKLKIVIWSIAIMSLLLGLLGITQGVGHDFFRTVIGQKLITPNIDLSNGTKVWDAIDAAAAEGGTYFNFTFKNREIYQTVYNINYVSFYLTLLIPLFGMLFIRSYYKESGEPVWKKTALLVLFAVLIYNFIASKSSGGYFGLGVIGIIGIIMLNKQLLQLWKPLAILFLITGIVFGITTDIWLPELMGAFRGFNKDATVSPNEQYDYANTKPFVDYIITGETIEFSVNGDPLIIDQNTENESASLIARDADEKKIPLQIEADGYASIRDERFYDYVKLGLVRDGNGNLITIVNTAGDTDWYFIKDAGRYYYINGLGKIVSLNKIDHAGFKNHLHFGSNRGYIWSASLPLMKRTVITGFGADVFCLEYPQDDYAWKYNSGYQREIIVDKPHNMYLHMGICTGVVSLCSILALYGMYVVQSIKLFWKRPLDVSYLSYIGFGLFCGSTAFMVTGLVNDSTVSVMPLYYTLLGVGLAVNKLLQNDDTEKTVRHSLI